MFYPVKHQYYMCLILQSGKISANVFSCSFNEWVAARYAVEKMCQEEFFTCPACTPDMLAVCVDGNRKHYRFKNTARYFSVF